MHCSVTFYIAKYVKPGHFFLNRMLQMFRDNQIKNCKFLSLLSRFGPHIVPIEKIQSQL